MNPLVRYFLPSQVRGVYRFDDAFREIDRGTYTYSQFVSDKLRFLPYSLIEPIRRCARLSDDFSAIGQQVCLSDVPLDTKSRRANAFFRSHKYFEIALQGKKAYENSEKYLEINFVKEVLAPLLNEAGLNAIQPQKQIGPYYVDFALDGPVKLVLEVDGFGKFAHRQDLDNFIERQNFITCQGWKVIRFTYGQIMHSTSMTLKILHDMLNADPYLQDFLLTKSQEGLFDDILKTTGSGANVFDLVNGFYHVQDWFVEYVIGQGDAENELALRDESGFPFPMVALALSALYQFIDAVTSVVDVDLKLPLVTISGAVVSSEWRPHLHPFIIDTIKQNARAIKVDLRIVQQYSASLPAPVSSKDSFPFRKGLQKEEIHQRLDYITREVFGYSEGTNRFQDKVLERIFDGKDTLGISATGSGKSFCFWLPSLLKPGLTIVIAPLRSLMRDQRLTLQNYGIASMEFINSDNTIEHRHFMEEAKLGYIRLLYISPERLRIKKFVEALEELQQFVPINAIAIDEAHCISEWGHDFRPSYLKLPSIHTMLKEKNPELCLIALTATAGQQVEKDMRGILKFAETDVMREPVADRERFSYQIVPVGNGYSKTEAFHKILKEDLPKALKQQSLNSLLARTNSRDEKDVGIVFCIYADSHGINTVYDGTSHYLFETMKSLESERIFISRRGNYPKYDLDAFSSGKVRSFASKPPTLCPKCYSYAYTSSSNIPVIANDDDVILEDEDEPAPNVAGMKMCLRCLRTFPADKVKSPPGWEKLIKDNQNDFKNSRFDILVATKGFGMGIDKSSVRFVIHTSLSSGIESWYQEVGRAGRDNERAHIVLLVDPPNDSCRKELEGKYGAKRPQCSWTGGCKHDRASICDYGKQHLFITRSYPGAETDAISALRMLDRLLATSSATPESPITIRSSHEHISRHELSLYRLMVLGLVDDYAVSYGRTPSFEVAFRLASLPSTSDGAEHLCQRMQKCLADYMVRYPTKMSRIKNYRPLDDYKTKIDTYAVLSQLTPLLHKHQYAFINTVYEQLLLLLDHTYEDVVKMRYDMLWNLFGMVNSWQDNHCQRVRILPYFEGKGSVEETYRCGCCNVCSPQLDFLDRVRPRRENLSVESSKRELDELLEHNILDIAKLRQLCDVFGDYRTATYAGARHILEGNANNLPALYLTREFSPPAELAANTKELIKKANKQMVSLIQLSELYETSAQRFKADLLLLLNDQDTTCDSPEGWAYLVEEAACLLHYEDAQIASLHDCLQFFLIVEDIISLGTESYRKKAAILEEILNG